MTDSRRYAGLGRTLRLVADLMSGSAHDRNTAAKLLDIGGPAAARQLKAVADHVPGMAWDHSKTPARVRFDRKKLSSPPDFPSAIAACFGRTLAPLFEGTGQESGMRRAFDYVLGQSARRRIFKDIERKFTFLKCGGEIALPDGAEVLDELIDAVLHCREVRFTYKRFAGTEEEINIQPLSLCIYHHQIYVVGRRADGALHPYRLARVAAISEDNGSSFTYPTKAEYDPQRLFADSFGIFIGDDVSVEDVELDATPRWRTYALAHRWHPSQKIDIEEDGRVRVQMRVGVCRELEAWVLSFGDEALVLKPTTLRDGIAKRLTEAANRYEEDPDAA